MTQTLTDETAVRARRARTAVFVVFTLAGIGFATIASRIPDIRDVFDVSPAQLGIILLSLSVGSVLGLPSAGPIARRAGREVPKRWNIFGIATFRQGFST